MLVSETEQDLACNGGQVAAFEVVFMCLFYLRSQSFWLHICLNLFISVGSILQSVIPFRYRRYNAIIIGGLKVEASRR